MVGVRKFSLMVASLGLAGFLSALHAQNLITNGSFEAEDYHLSPFGNVWNQGTGPSGWTQTSSTQGVSIYNVGSANDPVFPLPQFGTQFYYVGQAGGQGTVSQSVGLNAGQSYLLTFYFSPLTDGQNASLDLTITDGSQTLLPGLTYDYFQAGSGSPTWQMETYSFTASDSATYTFQFTSQGAGDAVVIDNVSLVAIPEPATTASVIGTVIFSVILLRRRFAATA